MFRITSSELKPEDAHDTYMVCNRSVEHEDAPRGVDGVLRVDLVVIFVCDTIIGADNTKCYFRI